MILQQYTKNLSENKISIIKHWMLDKEVEELFKLYNLDINLFAQKYASIVIDFYIQTINNDFLDEKYKEMNVVLLYIKENMIKNSETFVIFKSFKYALIKYFDDSTLTSIPIEKEINLVFESVFSDVLKQTSEYENNIIERLKYFSKIVNKHVIMSSMDINGIITDVTDSFCKISGYPKEELIGKCHSIVNNEDMNPKSLTELWTTIKDGDVWQGELKNLKKDGGYYWVNVKIEPLFDISKNIIGYDTLGVDITPIKTIEEQKDMLTQQSKSAAMGEMISMIAHQWRQPLQLISILVQKLPITKMIEGELSDEILEKVLKDVNLQLEYMTKTIDDFRNFFMPNKIKDEIQIDQLVKKALNFLVYMFEIDSIKINVEYKENRVLKGYINELVQVLINILKNARDVMIEKKIEDRLVNIRTYCNDNYAVIEIEDNAGGISKEVIGKIFNPYFTTKIAQNGTGLGLYMSKTIIEEHSHGKLTVSNSNLGAVFKIELPLGN